MSYIDIVCCFFVKYSNIMPNIFFMLAFYHLTWVMTMKNWVKNILAIAAGGGAVIGTAYYFPEKSFIAFVVGWLFLIPAAFFAYIVYGLWKYMAERKHRITVMVKPTEAMRALARKDAELTREKEILQRELQKELKH